MFIIGVEGTLERKVQANLVYREFTRVGVAKMPDQNHGPLGPGAQAAGDPANPREHCSNSPR
jgi:hypothetical protein